ncbi:MAG: hypothetical protein KC609_07935, partial [Myxococcales bacterium]|nr:hypothetical protein [Myxococcales bacterium]
MGGYGSGSRMKWGGATTDDCVRIDLDVRLARELIRPGFEVERRLTWTWGDLRDLEGEVTLRSFVVTEERGLLNVAWRFRTWSQSRSTTFSVTTTETNFGGTRWWFVCRVTS